MNRWMSGLRRWRRRSRPLSGLAESRRRRRSLSSRPSLRAVVVQPSYLLRSGTIRCPDSQRLLHLGAGSGNDEPFRVPRSRFPVRVQGSSSRFEVRSSRFRVPERRSDREQRTHTNLEVGTWLSGSGVVVQPRSVAVIRLRRRPSPREHGWAGAVLVAGNTRELHNVIKDRNDRRVGAVAASSSFGGLLA